MSTRAASIEAALWALLALILAASMTAVRPAPFLNDSYRYLDAAGHIRDGRGLTSSLVYYDLERAHGQIPFPLTHWPPGYPAAIAAASAASGGDVERAARAVSCLAYAGTAALLVWALQLTGVSLVIRGAVLSLFVFNAVTLGFATAVLSESLFMCCTAAAVVGLIRSEDQSRADRVRIRAAAAAAVLAGLTYWIRYAGIFVIAGVGAYAAVQWAMQRTRLRRIYLSLAAIPVGMFGVLAVRNALLVGNWRGGNEMPTDHPLPGVLRDYLIGHLHLAFGDHAWTFSLPEGLFVAGVLGTLFALIGRGPRRPLRWHAGQMAAWCDRQGAAPLLVTLCVLFYTAGMIYAGTSSAVSFGTRMFVPILPLYLLLVGIAVSRLAEARRPGRSGALVTGSLVLVCAAYVGINARDLSSATRPDPEEVLDAAWATPGGDGQPLREWIETRVAPGEVLLAGDGQATGHVLQRSTVGLVTAEFSPVRWACDSIAREMARFRARYVVVYRSPAPALGDSLALLQDSPFVAASVDGPPPCRCVVVADNADIRILTCPPSF